MIVTISPAKTMDFSGKTSGKFTSPDMLASSLELIGYLRKLSPTKLSQLMDLSPKLAQLNTQRYQDFSAPFTAKNARQAIFAFSGEVYNGLKAENFTAADLTYAQNHLRILSGLYGLLRPLDLMQPYRLEMGTKLATKNAKNLYQFWGDKITDSLNTILAETNSKALVNLASNEYSKAINYKSLSAKTITPIFKEKKGDNYKIVMIYAKQARGLMASFIVKNRIDNVADIKGFNEAGYKFSPQFSKENELVFVR